MVDAARGLTSARVAELTAQGRFNDVPTGTTRSIGAIVRSNVFTPFTALLGSLLAIILVVGPIQDALFGVVLVANAVIGIVQEVRAKRTLDRLTLLSAPKARVVRDGQERDVAVRQVVEGEVLQVSTGGQFVVDGTVLEADGLEVDESLLTGEAEPIVKNKGDEVMSGSFVVAGSGRYEATRIGREAYAAKLAEQARRFKPAYSELRAGINKILKYVTIVLIPTGALLFWSQVAGEEGWRHSVSGAVAGTVAMVPEGLVLLTSLAFAVAVVRLARRSVLVQDMPSVETLARVDVVCIDKTGTLTSGEVEVQEVIPLDGQEQAGAEQVLAAIAASDSAANATMKAIGRRYGPQQADGWKKTGSIAFSSARKWSAVSFGERGTYLLGAPDILLESVASSGAVSETVERLSRDGKRVVLLARSDQLRAEGDDGQGSPVIPSDLRPVAVVALSEAIRPSAEATLSYFAEQNVTVKVISGDDVRTVSAIAARLGLPGADKAMDGADLPDEPDALAEVLETNAVFGRVKPEQKRAMVMALRSKGHVVAMTGDGVNDALALKDADIGVAMGSGSDATRSVAEIVLLDSDFSSLPQVVAEGRRVLGNIERTSGLYLTKTFYAMVLALATGVGSWPFPFLPRHLTLIGAVTIGIPSFFLALAPNTLRFRRGFVRRVVRFAAPAGALAGIATILAYTLARHEPGVSLMQARTAAVVTLTFVGLLILTIVAAPLTGWRQALVLTMAGLFATAMVLPATQEFFALDAPPAIVLFAAIGIAAIVWFFARIFVPGEEPVGPTGRITADA